MKSLDGCIQLIIYFDVLYVANVLFRLNQTGVSRKLLYRKLFKSFAVEDI